MVELKPSYEADPIRFAQINTKAYIDIILSNETAAADIIVFPEATLNRQSNSVKLPTKGEKVVPCGSEKFSDIVKNISCAAKQSAKYVVINLYMERDCKEEADATKDVRPCSRGNLNIYNTAVAFDRVGAVVAMYKYDLLQYFICNDTLNPYLAFISRYRKYNLFLEGPEVRRTLDPDVVYFDTDFDVRFGLIICFDLNLQYPTADLLSRKVDNFVYPTMWWSELPFHSGKNSYLLIANRYWQHIIMNFGL